MECNFNETIQELLTDIVKKMVTSAIEKSEGNNMVLDVFLVDSKHDEGDPQSFVSQLGDKSTCWNHLTYRVTIENGQGEIEKLDAELNIPYQMQGGVFIIDGRTRIATNSLETDYDCYYNLNATGGPRFQLNEVRYRLNLLSKDGRPQAGMLVDWSADGEDHTKHVKSQEELEALGLDRNLSEEQRQKINYLLDVPFEDRNVVVGKELTYDLLQKIKHHPSVESRVDGPVNLKIYDVPHALVRFIHDQVLDKNGKPTKNYATALNSIKRSWVNGHTINLSGLMGAVLRFLRNPSSEDVDIATVINPLVYDQLHGKITMKKFLPYSASYADIIDAP